MVVSILLLTGAAGAVAQLVHQVARATLDARLRTSAAMLAADKMEELRALAWGTVGAGAAAGGTWSDVTTDLSGDVPASGGPGLRASPPDTLRFSIPPYVDFLDDDGRWAGTGTEPPTGTAFVRRWAIRPWVDDPDGTLVLEVSVVPYVREARRHAAAAGSVPDEVRLVTIRTRKWS